MSQRWLWGSTGVSYNAALFLPTMMSPSTRVKFEMCASEELASWGTFRTEYYSLGDAQITDPWPPQAEKQRSALRHMGIFCSLSRSSNIAHWEEAVPGGLEVLFNSSALAAENLVPHRFQSSQMVSQRLDRGGWVNFSIAGRKASKPRYIVGGQFENNSGSLLKIRHSTHSDQKIKNKKKQFQHMQENVCIQGTWIKKGILCM